MNNPGALKSKKAISCSMFVCEDNGQVVDHYVVNIKDQPSEAIFQVLSTGFYGRLDYFAALQAGAGASSKFIFPEIYENGQLLAAGCFQELRLAGKDFDEPGSLLSGNSKFSRTLEKAAKSAMRLGTGKKRFKDIDSGK